MGSIVPVFKTCLVDWLTCASMLAAGPGTGGALDHFCVSSSAQSACQPVLCDLCPTVSCTGAVNTLVFSQLAVSISHPHWNDAFLPFAAAFSHNDY